MVALLALAAVLVGGGAIYTLCRLCECAGRPRNKPLPPQASAAGRPQQFITAVPPYNAGSTVYGAGSGAGAGAYRGSGASNGAGSGAYGASNGAYGASNGAYGAANGHSQGSQPQGITYDSRTGMFMLNGQPYGRMQGGV